MPGPEPGDVAELLLRKASSDLAAARALADDVDQVSRNGVDIPVHLAEARLLSPWAVTWRYEDLDEPLDRAAALAVATDALEWAREILAP